MPGASWESPADTGLSLSLEVGGEKSLALDSEVVALTIEDRERILPALDDVRTDALAELRGILLHEHEWRMREGLR